MVDIEQVQKWSEFCHHHTDAWASHFVVSGVRNGQYSFLLYLNNELVAVCPFLIEEVSGQSVGSLLGLSLPAPLIIESINRHSKLWKKIFKVIHQEYDDLALQNNVKRLGFDYYLPYDLTLTEELRNNYLPITQFAYYIDLTLTIEAIFAQCSKGHKANIKSLIGIAELKWISSEEVRSQEEWKNYAKYFESLNQKNHDYYYDLFQQGLFEFVFCYLDGMLISGSAFVVYADIVIYEFSVSLTDNKQPSHHFIIYMAMQKYQSQNRKVLELGIISYSSHFNCIIDSKKEAIRSFKSGFSPQCTRRNFAEKYFDQNYFETTMETRVSQLSHSLFE